MSHIFVDESGDLGFDFRKKKTSRFFVVAGLFVRDKRALERIVKGAFRSFSTRDARNHSGSIHSYRERPQTRRRILLALREKGAADVVAICLDKRKVRARFRDEKHSLYNYVANLLLRHILMKKLASETGIVRVVAARRETNKFLNRSFSERLKGRARDAYATDIEIDIASPSAEKSLQVADVVSWSIFRKYEHGDPSYRDMIRADIIEVEGPFDAC